MSRSVVVVCLLTLALAATAPAGDAVQRYTIERPENVAVASRPRDGRNALFVTLRFRIRDISNRVATDILKDEIVVEEALDARRIG